jgi:hypothetical protein
MSNGVAQIDIKQAEAFFRGTETLCNFVDKHVMPVLQGFRTPSDYDKPMLETYFRMQYWILSLEKLAVIVDSANNDLDSAEYYPSVQFLSRRCSPS